MDQGQIYGRSMTFPPRIGTDGRVLWSEGATNIRESIRLILLTEPGERLMMPEFGAGLRSFLFQPNTLSTMKLIEERIRSSLILWEPRIALEAVEVTADESTEEQVDVAIRYRLVATGELENVNLALNMKS